MRIRPAGEALAGKPARSASWACVKDQRSEQKVHRAGARSRVNSDWGEAVTLNGLSDLAWMLALAATVGNLASISSFMALSPSLISQEKATCHRRARLKPSKRIHP